MTFLNRVRHKLAVLLSPSADPESRPTTPTEPKAHTSAQAKPAAESGVEERYIEPNVEDTDLDTNLRWNAQRWGQSKGWTDRDSYGYRWGGGHQQTVGDIAKLADDFFRPHTDARYDLDILELSPGGGRFTAEIIRYASSMTLVDMNESCIQACTERFQYMPTPMRGAVNDGQSLAMVADSSFDAIVCFDSMVHMHPSIIDGYVRQMSQMLRENGFVWLDHSGRGQREAGHRTAMTAEKIAEIAESHGLIVADQKFRNDWDCITVLRRAA